MIANTISGEFWESLANASSRLLMLDYDGTLAPHRVERDRATPYPEVITVLEEIRRSRHTRLVIISGRGVNDLLPLLSMPNPPECWGCHGLERRFESGKLIGFELTLVQQAAIAAAVGWALDAGHHELSLEPKPMGLAFHWRGQTQLESKRLRKSVGEAWCKHIGNTGLELVEFDGGLEIRPVGLNKGSAVKQLLSEEGNKVVAAYLGDDLTDEDAFEAIGDGLSILVRPEVRDTRARVWLKPPDELLDFLILWNQYSSQQTEPQEPL